MRISNHQLLNFNETRRAYPFPWRTAIIPPGRVVVVDSTGKEVPLFTLTDFVCEITAKFDAIPTQQPAAQTAAQEPKEA